MNRHDPLNLDEFVCFAVYSANSAFNRAYKPILDAVGLTYPQYIAMVALWQKDDQTVGEIGHTLLLESSTLTPLLKRLEAAGLVQRRRDLRDERLVRVALTEKGHALRDAALRVPGAIGAAAGMSAENARHLRESLVDLRETLNHSSLAPETGSER